jgi:drug/metabolite transporter (DMT)-like permease
MAQHDDTTRRGTLVGATAVLLWAALATLAGVTDDVPPLQLLAMSFSLATGIGAALWWREARREGVAWMDVARRQVRLPPAVWALGLYGLFGYHLAYFLALRLAPPADASLINYLWPLLIVLFSALLPGERLRGYQVIGALLGFAGVVLLVGRGGGPALDGRYVVGYGLALGCAVIWASYSVLSRYFGRIPTSAVGAFCAATAALAWISHALVETTVWPVGWTWAAVAALGLGPVGAAFYTWDYGVKRGDIQTLSVLAYGAPPLSTLLLIAAGMAEPSWALVAASVLIGGGALVASGWWRRGPGRAAR